MAGKDDDPKPVKTNASPVLKPPGLGLGGHAPPGAVGTEKAGVIGPVYIGWTGDQNPFESGRSHEPTRESPPQPDKTAPRFHQTDDPEVDRHYGQDHVMVRGDGSEMRPGDWGREQADDAKLDKFHAEEGDKEHGDDAALDKFHEPPAPDKGTGPDDGMRPPPGKDHDKGDDDGIDR